MAHISDGHRYRTPILVRADGAGCSKAWLAHMRGLCDDGSPREGADVAELTGMLPDPTAAGWPERMRVIVGRERPHPGAQITLADIDGWRFQALATDTEWDRWPQGAPRPRTI